MGLPSGFEWEQDALGCIYGRMRPCAEPYRAWQTFTFTARDGRDRECDLLIAMTSGLYLVEIKSHPGRATDNGSLRSFRGSDRTHTIEDPQHLTGVTCKGLKDQLGWVRREPHIRPQDLPIPFVKPVIFLSGPMSHGEFDNVQWLNVCGRDELTGGEDALLLAPTRRRR